ncbi:MAG: hypothetical protein KAX77_00855 [Xanthomonadales bacterium]|nr:hypothetical protein [Xanthomonadales bacterium]
MDRIQLLDDMERQLETYRAHLAALEGLALADGYIIKCQGFALQFDTSAGYAEKPRTCSIFSASRFPLATATRIARTVRNGNGEVGEAVHIRQALQVAIDDVRGLIRDLSAVPA